MRHSKSRGSGLVISLALVIGIAGFAVGVFGVFKALSAEDQIEHDAEVMESIREAMEFDQDALAAIGERLAVLERPLGRQKDGSATDIFEEFALLRRDVQDAKKFSLRTSENEEQLRRKLGEFITRFEALEARFTELDRLVNDLKARVSGGATEARPFPGGGNELRPPK